LPARITERTLYPDIKRIFEEHGAKVVQEPIRETLPDFIVEWLGENWLVSIKIGDATNPGFLKKALVQYIREREDFKTNYGMIIFYPSEIKNVKPTPEAVEDVVRRREAYFIVIRPQMELRRTLSDALSEIERTLRERILTSLNLGTVVAVLRAHIEDLMREMSLSEGFMLRIIRNPELFFGINPVEEGRRRRALGRVSSFLSAYIFLSQMLFLRLYCEKGPTILEGIDVRRIGISDVKTLFTKLREINYAPIFDINVLDFVPENLVQDTFRLLFGLQLENIRYELPGRLFHELIPGNVRKLLAAFYTRPIAAYLLAQLTIENPDATVLDPACGSGTILTMAYRRKLELWRERGLHENPHRKFCEEQIYGCDIMPFAVHLTNANLVAMDPLTTVDLTLIALGDSLKLAPSTSVQPGHVTLARYIPGEREGDEEIRANAFKRTGDVVSITLKPVDVVLMNPPFTKAERGIKEYVETEKFKSIVGEEVGLWGHFLALADVFLKDNGLFGAVLPINLLRGRESEKVREIVFRKWLPLYIIKASRNYGFSEYAEYRDILVIARKTRDRPEGHRVKFCIVKKDLNMLTEEEARRIAERIKTAGKLRNELLDIDSYPLEEVLMHFRNMMPFISGPSLEGSEALRRIIEEAERIFRPFPAGYFKEGYGPRPRGVSGFMFVTRPGEGRTEEAFLILDEELDDKIVARTQAGVQKFEFSRRHFLPSLRTPVGLGKMDVTGIHDYVAKEPYEGLERIMELSGFRERLPENYWESYIRNEFDRSASYITISRRINPYSPAQKLIAFRSKEELIVSDLFHAIREREEERSKAVVVLMNSIFFLSYFFSLKEETTGRYIDIRQHDLNEMKLFPSDDQVKALAEVYERYKDEEFPSLRNQLDTNYDSRYSWFWGRERRGQETLFSPPEIEPSSLRIEFDMDVINAVGANLSEEDVKRGYEAIVMDMIVTRGLRRD